MPLLGALALSTIAMSGWPWSLFKRPPGPTVAYAKEILEIYKRGPSERDDLSRLRGRIAEIPNRGPASCLLLGHCYYRRDRLAGAVYAYRYGLSIAPTDKRLRESLAFVRAQVSYPLGTRPPEVGAWISSTAVADGLLWLMFASYCLACICGTAWLTTRERRWAKRSIACLAIAIVACAGSLAAAERVRANQQPPLAIINQDGTEFRLGNGNSYPLHESVPMLTRGMEAKLIGPHGAWTQIELGSGQVGWVRSEKVLVDLE